MALLTVTGLHKAFGGNKAVDGVDFTLAKGELLALIGPNGAGKTTVFNLLSGQLPADRGSIRLAGQELLGRGPREICRMGVGRTFQIAETFSSLSVLENVQMALLAADRRIFACWRRADGHRRDDALHLLGQVGMQDQAEQICADLSYGDVKRVELAMAMANGPELLLMDEPTAGMGPAERLALMALTRRWVDRNGSSVLFTEHSMDVVFAFADRIVVLAEGRVIADAKPQHVRQDTRVQQVYFGSGKTFENVAQTGGGAMSAAPDRSQADPHRSAQHAGSLTSGLRHRAHSGSDELLEAHALCGWYAAAQVLRDVDLTVRRGQVVALMGRNGAGKSTVLKAMMGLLPRRSGQVRFLGQDIARAAPYEVARLGLGYVPEDRRIFTELTVRENLDAGRQPPRRWPDGSAVPQWTPQALFALFPNLASMPGRLGGHMSGGEQQMLSVARTLMGNPFLVLLDEPSEGVAPVIVEQMVASILLLKRQGVGILLSEQNLFFASQVADYAYVLEKGRVRHHSTMADLLADEATRQAYLGL